VLEKIGAKGKDSPRRGKRRRSSTERVRIARLGLIIIVVVVRSFDSEIIMYM